MSISGNVRLPAGEPLLDEIAHLRMLLDSTVEGILGADAQGICTFCNRAALQQLGYCSEHDLIGRDLHSMIHHSKPDGKPHGAQQCALHIALAAGKPAHLDEDFYWKSDGSGFPVECWMRPIRINGAVAGAVISFWDTSRRKQLEAAQNLSEQLFRSIAENSADLIAVVNKAGDRIYNNPAYERVLGYTPQELKRTASFEQIHPDDREKVKRAADEALRTGVGQVVEYRMQRKDGSYVSLESHGSFIRSSQGEIEAFVISARDIGRRRFLEEAEKLSAIGQLAAGIAHEINTPVQFVSDNISFLQDAWTQVDAAVAATLATPMAGASDSSSPAPAPSGHSLGEDWPWLQQEVPKAISQSLEGVRRISKIVSAMRRFSHTGGGTKEFIDLNEALEATLTVAQSQIKNIADVERDFEPSLPLIECFADEINQAFLNLIINASHAMRDASEKRTRQRGRLLIRTRHVDHDVQVDIQDNGCGIAENIRSRVFEPFFTTKQVGEGTGQGLSICHDIIVSKHGGRIWFDTEVGKGTTFYVRLPIQFHEKSGESQ